MPRQRHKVQSLTAPLSSGSQAVRLATLRKRDAWGTTQQPLRFAHLPEMREQGGRATLLGATEHSSYGLCFRALAGLAKFCRTDPLSGASRSRCYRAHSIPIVSPRNKKSSSSNRKPAPVTTITTYYYYYYHYYYYHSGVDLQSRPPECRPPV